MDMTLQVRERGVLTLPDELRERYGIRPCYNVREGDKR